MRGTAAINAMMPNKNAQTSTKHCSIPRPPVASCPRRPNVRCPPRAVMRGSNSGPAMPQVSTRPIKAAATRPLPRKSGRSLILGAHGRKLALGAYRYDLNLSCGGGAQSNVYSSDRRHPPRACRRLRAGGVALPLERASVTPCKAMSCAISKDADSPNRG